MDLDAIVFENRRGQKLVGVMHHAEGDGPHPCVVVCHGFAGNKVGSSRRFVEFARFAAMNRLSVFRFDFAGSGDSEGELVDLTLDNELDDLQAAITAVSNMSNVDASKVGVVGHCMGAVTAIRYAVRNPQVYKTVAWAPFVELEDTLCKLIGEDAFSIVKEGDATDFLYNNQLYQCGPEILKTAQDINMFEEIANMKQRLLVIHGTEDATVPLENVKRLITHAHHEADIQFEIVEGAHHSFPYHKEELFQLTLDYIHN